MKFKTIATVIAVLALSACSASNVPDIKNHAKETIEQAGFKIVGYEGFKYGSFDQWGGCVWYVMERNSVTYDGCISKWGDEYHIYSLYAKDAIAATKK